MASITGQAIWMPVIPRVPAGFFLIGLVILFADFRRADCQVPDRQEGLFVTVRNPITDAVVASVTAKTKRALERKERPVRTIVFDFNPANEGAPQPAGTKGFGACDDLASFLLTLQEVNTVAFVHGDVTAHTVLPVLACREIVMSGEARLGNVAHELTAKLLPHQINAYAGVAERRGWCPAIVLKMLDRDMEVLEARHRGRVWHIDKARRVEEAQKGVVVARQEPVLLAGSLGFYSAAQAQKFGLCKLIKETRSDVVEAYQLTVNSLREDPLEGREPVAFRIVVNETISKALGERLRRQIDQAMGRNANVIILQLECGGGDLQVAEDLARYLRSLKQSVQGGEREIPVMTIAYIPENAPDAATMLALGCTEIAAGKKAILGDFEAVVTAGKVKVSPEQYADKREALVGLARDQGYSPLLARGMLDERLVIYHVHSRKGQPEWKLIDQEEWDRDQAADGEKKWDRDRRVLIKPAGQFLKLDAKSAYNLGLVREMVDDYEDLCRNKYGLTRVRDIGYDFLYRLAEFIGHPVTAIFLFMIGFACLILELKVPGVGLPGVLAAVCFLLYFWAQSQLTGQITMLALLLFILGLVLIGLEIFLLPGSIIMGVSGIILVVLSLGLATLAKKPETAAEWFSFGRTLGGVGIGLVGAIVLAFVAAWYLPSIPYASRLILAPPSGTEEHPEPDAIPDTTLASPDLALLLGAIGVAATALRPAGIARFGDDFVDVVTEGGYVEAGVRVQVIEIEGNRVVVKEV